MAVYVNTGHRPEDGGLPWKHLDGRCPRLLERAEEGWGERQALKGFDRIHTNALVFQTSRGNSPGRRNALRALQVAAENAGLVADGQEPVGLHDLRHSLAANSFALGLTDVEVARLLRHANPKVTLTVYAGLTDKAASKIAEKMTASGFGS